jgi:hypothetical protein
LWKPWSSSLSNSEPGFAGIVVRLLTFTQAWLSRQLRGTTVETRSAALPIAWGEISGREVVVAIQLILRISGGKVCPTALRGIPGVHASEEK